MADADTEAAIAEAGTEEQDQKAIARKLFNLGAKAYERGKYGHAYGFFTRADELAARPGLLFSRAQALRKLGGRRKEAIALYEAYLATGHGVRDADAKAGLAELPRRPATRRPTPPRAARSSTRAARSTSGATMPTPPTSSIAGESPAAPADLLTRPGAAQLGGRREDAIALYEAYLATDSPTRNADAE